MLSHISENDWSEIERYGHNKKLHSGEILVKEGNINRILFILLKGRLGFLSVDNEKDSYSMVGTCNPLSVIGGSCFFSAESYPKTVVATQYSELLCLAHPVFLKVMRKLPKATNILLNSCLSKLVTV